MTINKLAAVRVPIKLESGVTTGIRHKNLTPSERSLPGAPSAGPRPAARVSVAIPYELTAIREQAKAAGARWQKTSKTWLLELVPAAIIEAAIAAATAGTKKFYSNNFYMASSFVSGKASELGDAYEGDIARDAQGVAWKVVSHDDRRRYDEENDEWYTETTRVAVLATDDEIAELEVKEAAAAAQRAHRCRVTEASRRIRNSVDEYTRTMTHHDPENAEKLTIYKSTVQATWAWLHEVDGRRVISFRDYDSDWDAKGDSLFTYPWTEEMEADVRLVSENLDIV